MSTFSLPAPKMRLPQPLEHEVISFEAAKRAAAVLMRDHTAIAMAVKKRLAELEARDVRGRALVCIAPLPHSFNE
jgi:hypothetical protein